MQGVDMRAVRHLSHPSNDLPAPEWDCLCLESSQGFGLILVDVVLELLHSLQEPFLFFLALAKCLATVSKEEH